MAGEFIAIDMAQLTRDLKRLQDQLERLPPEAQDAGIDEANQYMLNVMRRYAPYKYVSRTEAYGQPFQSDRQRRFFFAALSEGRISVPYKRTQALSQGWEILGKGRDSLLVNEVPYAQWLQQRKTQANLPKIEGWKTAEDETESRIDEIVRRFEAGVKKALKKLGL